MKINAELVFGYGTLNYSVLNREFINVIKYFDDQRFNLDHRSLSKEKLLSKFSNPDLKWDELSSESFCFWPGSVPKHLLDFLSLRLTDSNQDVLIEIVEYYLSAGDLVYARLYDAEYDFWQNADQLSDYEMYSKPHKHLPKKKGVMNWDFIDISQNPGRRIMKKGFVEAVGSILWFPCDHFPEALWKQENVSYAKTKDKRYIRAHIYDHPFCASTGIEAEIQNKLRETLFTDIGWITEIGF